ncbi:PEP/pyruvate-binding domain-containing protein [Halobellus rufus]|uniref:PEP/pyruvate-binding domain-containing protein n=1 Tax=Halobellus rufus TaxID=1448860 RepID=UPI000678E17F|nr:PEP/pyruvate-binding domain-containing protein [Halobellus rufus]
MPHCIRFNDEDCHSEAVDLVGGKNASLGELRAAGVRVPPGFAVTTDFYTRFLASAGLEDIIQDELNASDLTDAAAAEDAGEDIRSAIKSEPFPEDLDEALEVAWNKLEEAVDGQSLEVAVRSSATAEDLPDASFAGQQDTYLHVSGFEDVKERVRDCIASLFTARAISYREENGFDHDIVQISVGIQKMVDARASGVMFTVNPANGDRSKVRIESNWGLGESVVAGEVTPDSFLVDKPPGIVVERNISTKQVMTKKTDSEVENVPVPEAKREEASISNAEIERLNEYAKKIEKHYGQPQDIEWAIEGGLDDDSTIYILQSRPETTWNDGESGTESSDSETTEATSNTTNAVDQMVNVLTDSQ